MKESSDFERFKNLTFDDFKKLAEDDSLSKYQKIGFPDIYRQNKEAEIFNDIIQKLGFTEVASNHEATILDIGPGCSDLPKMIIDYSAAKNYKVLLVDSKEMLDQLDTRHPVETYVGYFPDDATKLLEKYNQKVDYIIGYSIFHYVFYNTCIYRFLDSALSLLRPGGKMLIGDVPNISKRRRFFSTEAGVKFHQDFTKTASMPENKHLQMEFGQIDEGVLTGIVQRYQNFGFNAYILPQPSTLPFHNRRDDLVFERI